MHSRAMGDSAGERNPKGNFNVSEVRTMKARVANLVAIAFACVVAATVLSENPLVSVGDHFLSPRVSAAGTDGVVHVPAVDAPAGGPENKAPGGECPDVALRCSWWITHDDGTRECREGTCDGTPCRVLISPDGEMRWIPRRKPSCAVYLDGQAAPEGSLRPQE